MFKRLPEILRALQQEKKKAEAILKKDQETLQQMSGGDTPTLEFLSLTSTFERIFNEQWMGQQLPTAELTKAEIEKIQSKHFNMNAVEFATKMIESWRANGPAEFLDT